MGKNNTAGRLESIVLARGFDQQIQTHPPFIPCCSHHLEVNNHAFIQSNPADNTNGTNLAICNEVGPIVSECSGNRSRFNIVEISDENEEESPISANSTGSGGNSNEQNYEVQSRSMSLREVTSITQAESGTEEPEHVTAVGSVSVAQGLCDVFEEANVKPILEDDTDVFENTKKGTPELEGNRLDQPCKVKDRLDSQADRSDNPGDSPDLEIPQEDLIANIRLNLDDPDVVYDLLPEVHIRNTDSNEAASQKLCDRVTFYGRTNVGNSGIETGVANRGLLDSQTDLTGVVNDHINVLSNQSIRVNGLSVVVNDQSCVVDDQTDVVNDKTGVVNGPTTVVNGHSVAINSHRDVVVNYHRGVVNGQTVMMNGVNDQTGVVNGDTDVVNEKTGVVKGQTDVEDDKIGVINGQTDKKNGQTDVVIGQTDVVNGPTAVVNDQICMVNDNTDKKNGQTNVVNGQTGVANGQMTEKHKDSNESSSIFLHRILMFFRRKKDHSKNKNNADVETSHLKDKFVTKC